MTVKIVTDSVSDITQEEARQLGITVVPVYVRFGDKVYRDGVDIDAHEFYHKLVTSSVHPSTSSPSPGDFARVYEIGLLFPNIVPRIARLGPGLGVHAGPGTLVVVRRGTQKI